MGQKKSSKVILITIILLVILILVAGVAYAYFATDIFKSDKELFFKYATQMVDKEEGFIETKLKEYFEKRKNTPYSDEGSISVNVVSSKNQEQFENTNNVTLTFDGQVNTANSQSTQDISLNYSSDVKFPLSYKKVGNIIGIQTDYISSKYVAVDIERLQKLEGSTDYGEKIVSSLDAVEEFTNIQFSEEELQQIKDTYFSVINQQLQDSSFSKIEESNNQGYRLTLTGEELKNLIVKLLETLKEDQTTLDKINNYLENYSDSSKITTNSIDNLIKDIENNSEINDKNIEITVYQSQEKASKLVMKISDAITIQIEKNISGNSQQYDISIEANDTENEDNIKIALSANYAGLNSLQNVSENYELTLQYEDLSSSSDSNSIEYQFKFNNNVEFLNASNIKEFSDDNSMILNDYPEEQVSNFIQAVVQRLEDVNKMHMEQLGLEENENPLLYLIPQFGTYISATDELNTNNMSDLEVSTFNKKFENYESTNLQGVTVKGLLSTIQLNNESQEDDNRKITEIHFDGQEYEVTDQNIVLIKSSIETESAYRVEFEKNEDTGVIYRAVINKK